MIGTQRVRIEIWKKLLKKIMSKFILLFFIKLHIIPSLTVREIKKRYNPQFIRVTAFCDLVLLYSNMKL